jgi:diacylglycerol kinase (ATP)
MRKFIGNVFAIKNALFYSLSGLRSILKERAFRQELFFGIVFIVVELFRSTSTLMLAYMFSSYFLILVAESINSAIETIVNRISLNKHELSKRAKDIGSAVVFFAITHFCIIWILSFFAYTKAA